MKRCLVDVNVWLALLVRHHIHHQLARAWYDGLPERQVGLCRIVQLALVRLLANPSIMVLHKPCPPPPRGRPSTNCSPTSESSSFRNRRASTPSSRLY